MARSTGLCSSLCLVRYVFITFSEFQLDLTSLAGEMTDMSGVNQLDSLMNSDGTPNDLGKWYLGDHSST